MLPSATVRPFDLPLDRGAGRFVDLRRIGEGAQGIVYDALDQERVERVALKVLKPGGPGDIDQFKREFRGLTELTHENLPLLYELFSDERGWFFTMERIVGEDPRSFVTLDGSSPESRRVDVARVADIVDQLEAVLAFVHGQGFVHGDVKPSNVKVRPTGAVVLLDFGFVARSNISRSGFAGTTLYAAPELLANEHVVGPAQDLYALGSLAFELATGAPPFPGLGVQPMLDKNRRPAPAMSAGGFASSALTSRVARWLEADPTRRGAVALEPDAGESDDDELARLSAAYARCASGRSVVVDLEAPADFPRTSALERFLERCAGAVDTPAIYRSRASVREHLPFSALDGVLVGLGLHAEEVTTRMDLARELKSRLRVRSADGPLIMVLEDAQWLDADSAAVLEELFFPPRPRSLLLILARRRGPEFEPPVRLPIATEYVISKAQRRPSEHRPAPRSLDVRLASLASSERALLHVVSLSRAPLAIPTLVRLDRSVQVSRVLERLSRLELLRRESQTRSPHYVPWDEAVRERVLREVSTADRISTHRRLVDALDPSDVGARVEHLRGAGEVARARDLALEEAERASLQNAHARAAHYFELAFELTREPTCRLELGERLLTALERGGLTSRAARTALRLSDDVPSASERNVVFQVRAARLFLACGELGDGHRLLGSLCERFGMRWPRSEAETFALTMFEPRARPDRIDSKLERRFTRSVADALALIDPQRGYLFQTRRLSDARASGDVRQHAAALLGEVCYATARGRGASREVERHLAELSNLFAGGLPADLAVYRRFALALLDHHRLPSRRAVDALLGVERDFAALPNIDPATLGMVGLVAGHGLQLIGDLPGLRAQAERLAREAETRKDAFLHATARFGGHRAWLADDAPDVSRHLLSHIAWAEDPSGFHIQHWLRAEVEIETSLYEGDIEAGWERIANTRRVLTLSLLRRDRLVRMCSDFAYGRAIVARLAHDRAGVTMLERALLRRALLDLTLSSNPAAKLRGLMLQGALSNVEGKRAHAIASLERGLGLARRLAQPLHVALLELALGALDPRRAPTRARELLEREGVAAPARFLRVDLPGIELGD